MRSPASSRVATAVMAMATLAACSDFSEPTPLPQPGMVSEADIVLEPGDAVAGLHFQLGGIALDSVVGVGPATAFFVQGEGGADVVVAGESIRSGVVARIYLKAARPIADIRLVLSDVVAAGDALEVQDASAHRLVAQAPSARTEGMLRAEAGKKAGGAVSRLPAKE